MSRKYPGQSASRNIYANQLRQRDAHVEIYRTNHQIREGKERYQAMIEELKTNQPEKYAKLVAREHAHMDPTPPAINNPSKAASVTGATVLAGSAMAFGAALVSVGVGTAAVMNRTVLKDDKNLPQPERKSRSAGRVAGYTGGIVGGVGAIAMVSGSGAVAGLSAAGIASGVSAIGAAAGGAAIAGTTIVVALPALAAAAAGYGIYRAVKWLTN